MTCAYLDQGIGPIVVIGTSAAQRAVLNSGLELLTQTQREGTNISYALEYSAQMGKHPVTQHLVSIGVPTTCQALSGAAHRRGPGMDLLLAGLEGEDLAKAKSAAMSFRMSAGDFDKAYAMLDSGTEPDRYFISSAYSETQSHGNPFEAAFQEALDRALPRISREVLAASHLEFLVQHGRPVHIERALEILQRPVAALLPRVLGLRDAGPLDKLREFGAQIDDTAFGLCTHELTWDGKNNPELFIDRLCNCTIEDGYAGQISIKSVAPIFEQLLNRSGIWLKLGKLTDRSHCAKLRLSLDAMIPCIRIGEREQLHAVFDAWQTPKPSDMKFIGQARRDMHDLIDEAIAETTDLSMHACAP